MHKLLFYNVVMIWSQLTSLKTNPQQLNMVPGAQLVPLKIQMGSVTRVRTLGIGDNRDNVAAMLYFRYKNVIRQVILNIIYREFVYRLQL